MKIEVLRYNTAEDYTDGMLFVDGKFKCYTLEDGFNEYKIPNVTRIPDGKYKMTLRTAGGFHGRYKKRYGNAHKGMLWVRDVPNFKYILIHVGNTPKDTAGCLLVGDQPIRDEAFIAGSRKTYEDIYPDIAFALSEGEEVVIEYKTI